LATGMNTILYCQRETLEITFPKANTLAYFWEPRLRNS
jgi:hypothetical protein